MRRTNVDGRVLVFPLVALALVQILLVTTETIPVLRGGLADPDAYMRLNRVADLHDGGAWFDPVYPRINPPDGHALHWTRPLDVLLLAGAAPLGPFLGFRDALHLWGVVLNPLLTAGALVVILWASASVLDHRAQVLAGFAFVLQPTIIGYGSAGRPDHHSLLLLLFALQLALVPRFVARPECGRLIWLAGVVAALAVWVSVEGLTFVAVALATVAVAWLLGIGGMARAGLRYALACTLALAAALAVERAPAGWVVVESDRLSVLHVALVGAVAAFWAVALVGERLGRLRTPRARALTAGLVGGLILTGLYALFPELAAGPMGPIDPLYREVHHSAISEIQPLVAWSDLAAGSWGPALGRLLALAGLPLVAMVWVLRSLARERGRANPLWVFVATGLVLFLPLSLHQLRWSIWIQLLALIPYASLLEAVIRRVERSPTARRLVVPGPAVAAAGLAWAVVLPQVLPSADEAPPLSSTCRLDPIARFLETVDGPATIMTLPDFGPELLYRTGHGVLSIPNHRFQPGFTATYRTLAAADDAAARTLLDRHGIDLILLCPGLAEERIYASSESSGILYHRLVEGRGPGWLRPVELPSPLRATFKLFAVERNPGIDESIALAPAAGAAPEAAHGADDRNERR